MRTLRIVNNTREFELSTVESIQHSSGAIYSIKSFTVDAVGPRLGAKDRYGRDGSIITGDRKVSARNIEIGFDVTSAEGQPDLAYRDFIDDLLSMFDPYYAPVYLYDDQDDAGSSGIPLRAMVELADEAIRPADGLTYRVQSGILRLMMPDGYFETQEEFTQSSPSGGIATNETLNVTNSSRRSAYPVIEVTALADNALFRISNTTTGAYIEIGASDFLTGEIIEISSIDGSILLSGSDISASSVGIGSTMIELVPGVNTLRYESTYGDVDMTVRWRERWLR